VSGVKVGPQPLKTETRHIPDSKEAANQAQYKNMIWVLTRQLGIDNQMVPGWTGFNIRTRDSIDVEEDIIGYLPTINAPATQLTTVSGLVDWNPPKRVCRRYLH
jgi:hypothetical protein